MGSTSKPSILLIPGSFALPEFYEPVFELVRAKGYDIRGLHKPTVGLSARQPRPGAPPTMYDDAAYIAGEAEKLADEGKDVILVPHSYGGVPASQSTKGLSKKERQEAGKPGGIVSIAYLTCLTPALGQTAKDVLATVPPETQINLTEDGWMIHDPPEASAALSFSDLPLEEGTAWVNKFPQHSAISFVNELTHAGYKDVDVSYLVCEKDLVIPPAIQRAGIDMIERESGRKVDVTSIPRDHCPLVRYPEEVADWILKVAAKY
ncbi:hypothetical protein A1O7_07254 [Cladophialophora yegresii CBS 114405]|uniref:AB hydrolase-1 domain-containing protein n=1 Tax=Cladophialophora yegresii CBS 114405 TaxID=1182544 RepID=W9VW52_9EURO|nr:uncharacterized protein A1O7_07254 [Cladophialophora yegresii CBS 114405]EXJ56910.1 hypothetical protein A1O7_07254 [Cladophialophora yegresii CBS 114405]